ncbi:MAG: hypothetical protein IJ217_00505 [Clostridia bacterium]|nr:hypothetical protein [Clostridia bacterium]
MGKIYEKQEYESKKIASTFWWDTAGILFLIAIALGIIYGIFIANASYATAIKLGVFVYEHEMILNIISIILVAALVVGAECIAIKKIRKRAIVKKSQVNEIAAKMLIKYIILGAVVVIVDSLSNELSIMTIVSFIIEAAVGTLFGRYLISKEAED